MQADLADINVEERKFEKYFFGDSMNHYPPPPFCLPESFQFSGSQFSVAQGPA